MFNYSAKIIRVVDGDTFWAEIDLGFYIKTTHPFRMARINSPEIKPLASREAGLQSKLILEEIFKNAGTIIIRSEKTEKYGRWLADVTIVNPDKTSYNLNDWLIQHNYATAFMT